MDFGKLAKKAQQAIDKRGGNEALKKDLGELKNIAKGPGSAADKAKRAAEALKQPGAQRAQEAPGRSQPQDAPRAPVEDPNAPDLRGSPHRVRRGVIATLAAPWRGSRAVKGDAL